MKPKMVLQAAQLEANFNKATAVPFLDDVLTSLRRRSVDVVRIRVTSFIFVPLAFLVVFAICAKGIERMSRKVDAKPKCMSRGCVPLMLAGAAYGLLLIVLVPRRFLSFLTYHFYSFISSNLLPIFFYVTYDDSHLFLRCSV
jgi:hypothetical protein